jgi:hypothetical protein
MRRFPVIGLVVAVLLAALTLVAPLSMTAATAFASPRFQQQWQQDETRTPNLWGPLATAHDGQQEPYQEAPGGQRLVQYFDKGRMELTNGAVTSGLLATELVTGQLQLGDTSFQPLPPPAIPIAGDPDNPGPTYAHLATTAKSLCDPAPDHTGAYTQAALSASGALSVSTAARTDATTFTVYDAPTQHNVPKAFADYRTQAGVQTIGYARCEPFSATVKVAGVQQQVLVQVFERRVLTYTASNPAAFQVELGNIGQHYYRWRYGKGATPSAPTPVSTPTTPTTTVTAVTAVTTSTATVAATASQGNLGATSTAAAARATQQTQSYSATTGAASQRYAATMTAIASRNR